MIKVLLILLFLGLVSCEKWLVKTRWDGDSSCNLGNENYVHSLRWDDCQRSPSKCIGPLSKHIYESSSCEESPKRGDGMGQRMVNMRVSNCSLERELQDEYLVFWPDTRVIWGNLFWNFTDSSLQVDEGDIISTNLAQGTCWTDPIERSWEIQMISSSYPIALNWCLLILFHCLLEQIK